MSNGTTAYFPAFTVQMPPPLIGQGGFQKVPPTIPIQEGPEWRIPPFTAPPEVTPPTPPTPPAIDSGELEADYITRCTASMVAGGMEQAAAEIACQEYWDSQNPSARAAEPRPTPKRRHKR